MILLKHLRSHHSGAQRCPEFLLCTSQTRKFHDLWTPDPSQLILSVDWLVVSATATTVLCFCCWLGHGLSLPWEFFSSDTLLAHPFSSIGLLQSHLTDACAATSIVVSAPPHLSSPVTSHWALLCLFHCSFLLRTNCMHVLFALSIDYGLAGIFVHLLTSGKPAPGGLQQI